MAHRSYNVGNKTLVVMPTSFHKPQAQWQGPYPVRCKVGDVNYEVQSGHPKWILHVKMLLK